MSERIEALMRLKKAELAARLVLAEDKIAVLTLGAAAKAAIETPPPPETTEAAPAAPTIADLLRDGSAKYYIDGRKLVISISRPAGRQMWVYKPREFTTASERSDAMGQLAAHLAAGGQLKKEQWERFTSR